MKQNLLWWLLICTFGGILTFGAIQGWIIPLFVEDLTYLTYIIASIFVATTTYIFVLANSPVKHQNFSIPWAVSDMLVTMGLIGTVIGFVILMQGINIVDAPSVEDIKALLAAFNNGLNTALNTTLVGMVSSILLKVQLLIFESRELNSV